jgi:integrase
VYPAIGNLPVADVDVGMVLKVLGPMWLTTPVTAGRVRGRIESVLAYATARGYREGANPARWRHHLEHLLPRAKKVRAVRHHPALPFDQIAAFVLDLRKQTEVSAAALEFLILTAARSGEVLRAKVSEIDWTGQCGRFRRKRMKAGWCIKCRYQKPHYRLPSRQLKPGRNTYSKCTAGVYRGNRFSSCSDRSIAPI